MVMLYDGTELIVWNGDNGDYGYFDGDTLMAMVLGREGDNISVIYNGEPVATTMQQYMENEVDFLGGIIWYLENMSDYSNKGSEKIGNFDCIKYESEPDAIGLSYTFWVDKATGVFVKEQSTMTKDWGGSDLDEPTIDILYIVDSISVSEVPTVTSVYTIPTEYPPHGRPDLPPTARFSKLKGGMRPYEKNCNSLVAAIFIFLHLKRATRRQPLPIHYSHFSIRSR